jgi:hypothetical protein
MLPWEIQNYPLAQFSQNVVTSKNMKYFHRDRNITQKLLKYATPKTKLKKVLHECSFTMILHHWLGIVEWNESSTIPWCWKCFHTSGWGDVTGVLGGAGGSVGAGVIFPLLLILLLLLLVLLLLLLLFGCWCWCAGFFMDKFSAISVTGDAGGLVRSCAPHWSPDRLLGRAWTHIVIRLLKSALFGDKYQPL